MQRQCSHLSHPSCIHISLPPSTSFPPTLDLQAYVYWTGSCACWHPARAGEPGEILSPLLGETLILLLSTWEREQTRSPGCWLPSKVFPQSPPRGEGENTACSREIGETLCSFGKLCCGKTHSCSDSPDCTTWTLPYTGRWETWCSGTEKICRHSFRAVAHSHLAQQRPLCCDSCHENPFGRRRECKVNITRTGEFR